MEASAAFAAPPIELLPVGERPQGSEDHTVWCPTCMERVLERGDGCCVWCDTPLGGDSSLTVVEAPVVGLRNSTTTPEPEPVRLPRRRDRGHRRGKPYTDEQVIARIQLWAKLTGSPPSKADWTPSKLRRFADKAKQQVERHLRLVALYEMGDFPSETTVRDRFGSLNNALVAAGFEPRGTGRPASEENERAASSRPRPKTGELAIRRYFHDAQAAREQGGPALKLALYDLALSAICEADRIAGIEELPGRGSA